MDWTVARSRLRRVRWVRERKAVRYGRPRAGARKSPPSAVPPPATLPAGVGAGVGAAPTILSFLPDPGQRSRVAAGVRRAAALRLGSWRIEECVDESTLLRRAGERIPELVLVGEGGAAPGSPRLGSMVARFRAAFPAIPLVVYLGAESRSGRGLLELGRRGVAEVVEWGVSDRPSALAEMLVRVGSARDDRRVLERALELVPAAFRPMVRRGFDEAVLPGADGGRLTVDRLTWIWRAGARPSTLAAALRRAGLPPPGWWARWLVGLRAVSALRNRGATVGQVALSLGFESDGALRRCLGRFTGRPPTKLDAECFLQLLEERCSRGSGQKNQQRGERRT